VLEESVRTPPRQTQGDFLVALAIEPFLTAYDPSDLPGSSIDPLGFDRSYNLLANKLLPGLTNVASVPRYYSVLCAGISLTEEMAHGTPRARYLERLQTVLRFEQLWALANVLATSKDGSLPLTGLRGVRYAQGRVEDLQRKGVSKTTHDYPLLLNQQRYGAVGIYAAVSDGLKFLHRSTFDLTPDRGLPLGEAFRRVTGCPAEVERAVQERGEVSVAKLEQWGARAHVAIDPTPEERKYLREAFLEDDVRARTWDLLHRCPREEGQSEMSRLERMRDAARDAELHQVLSVILRFEDLYATLLLAFERLLFLARQGTARSFELTEVEKDDVIVATMKRTRARASAFEQAVGETTCPHPFDGDQRALTEIRGLGRSAAAATTVGDFVEVILDRHRDVQGGKFDRARRKKMPWLERVGARWQLSLAEMGELGGPPMSEAEILPHPYRTATADALGRQP
jgi:hypothetical protein